MSEITSQIKKLKNRVKDAVDKLDVIKIIPVAHLIGIPVQKDLQEMFEKAKQDGK